MNTYTINTITTITLLFQLLLVINILCCKTNCHHHHHHHHGTTEGTFTYDSYYPEIMDRTPSDKLEIVLYYAKLL